MPCRTITFGNFKGGTGKTTSSTLCGIEFAKRGFKTLLIDLDPQANATNLYLKTKENIDKEIVSFEKTLMSAIEQEDLKSTIIHVMDCLDILPSSVDFALYPRYMERKEPDYNLRVRYFDELIRPLKDDYDYIIIDIPPTISLITDSALYASDYCLIVLQTQERSLQGAEAFLKYIQNEVIDTFKAPMLDVLGILPVLLKASAAVDTTTLAAAREKFGSGVFDAEVKNMERVKRYDITGVTFQGKYDQRTSRVFGAVVNEIIERIGVEENELG